MNIRQVSVLAGYDRTKQIILKAELTMLYCFH